MKRLLGLLLILGTSSASAAHFSRVAGRFDCPGIGNSHNCAISIEAKLKASFLHRTGKGRLDVDLTNGQVHSFTDVDVEGGAAVYYHALEVSKTGRYVLIHLQRYEWSEYGLLDRATGNFRRFPGYPLFSPDDRWLAVVDGHENAQSVFQMWEVTDGGFRLVVDLTQGGWWPTDVEWVSPTAITYGRTSLPRNHSADVETVKAKLTLKEGAWR